MKNKRLKYIILITFYFIKLFYLYSCQLDRHVDIPGSLMNAYIFNNVMQLKLYVDIENLEFITNLVIPDELELHAHDHGNIHHEDSSSTHNNHDHGISKHDEKCFNELLDYLKKKSNLIETYLQKNILISSNNQQIKCNLNQITIQNPKYFIFELEYSIKSIKPFDNFSLLYYFEPQFDKKDHLFLVVYDKRNSLIYKDIMHFHGHRKKAIWTKGNIKSKEFFFPTTTKINWDILNVIIIYLSLFIIIPYFFRRKI